MIGNGETAALIGPDLAVRWLCLPRFDGTPFFGSALDPKRGGQLTLSWDGWDGRAESGAARGALFEQRYVPSTNVLQTSVTAGGLKVEATDSMPWGEPVLLRRITVTNPAPSAGRNPVGRGNRHVGGDVKLVLGVETIGSTQWDFHIRNDDNDDTLTITEADAALVIGWIPGSDGARIGVDRNVGSAGQSVLNLPRPAAGESVSVVVLLAYGADGGEATRRWRRFASELAIRPGGDPAGLQAEIDFWIDWLRPARLPKQATPDLKEAYVRGLLTVKLLTHERSGAILAAPTASFPAVPGGYDNWDYRFCWIRDGYYTARTLDEAGLHDEARAFYTFVLGLQEPEGHWAQPLYTLDGAGPTELLVEDLAGPGGEQPIRFGNAAYDQLQIDNEPSVLHGLWIHAQRTGDREFVANHWDRIRKAAEAMSRLWPQKENGIWEIRERRDHWIYGKALCAAGFFAAAQLADLLGHGAEADRWRQEGARIRTAVTTEGYCAERGAYLQTYDPHSPLDISALALVLWDVLPADDERMRSTVRAMERPLGVPVALRVAEETTDDPYWGLHELKGGLEMDGAFARYDYGAEPFYLPTLWMARYWLRAGDRRRAEELLRVCLRGATNLGLMAEHFNPGTGAQWGNFPQAFSHEELALTILEMDGL